MDTRLQAIAQRSARGSTAKLDALVHLFDEESLRRCFHQVDGRRAVGAVNGEVVSLLRAIRTASSEWGPIRVSGRSTS